MEINNLESLRTYVKNNGISNTVKYLTSISADEKNVISFAYNSSGYLHLSLLVYLQNN